MGKTLSRSDSPSDGLRPPPLLAESRFTYNAISRQLCLSHTAQINSQTGLQSLLHKR